MPKSQQNLPVFVFPSRIDFIVDATQHHKQVFTVHNPYDFPTKFKLLTTQKNRYKVLQREGVIQEKHCTDVLVRLHNDVFVAIEEEKFKLKPSISNDNKTKYFSRDRLRFEMSDVTTKNNLGHRDVECFIWRTKYDFTEYAPLTGIESSTNLNNSTIHDKSTASHNATMNTIMHNSFNFDSENENANNNLLSNSFNSSANSQINPVRQRGVNKITNDLLINSKKTSSKTSGQKQVNNFQGSIWVPVIAIIICLFVLSVPKEETYVESDDNWLPKSLIFRSTENQRLMASYVLGILTMIVVQYQQN